MQKKRSAKEAILKSRGGAFGIKFSDICIQNDQYGKPLVFYKDKKLDQTEISLSVFAVGATVECGKNY